MDQALRSSARSGDPVERAQALRRSGQVEAARRLLQDAVRDGTPQPVADQLDAWFPLPTRVHELLGWVESAVAGPEPGPRMAFGLCVELLGCLDPRIDRALEPVLRRCLVGSVHDPWEDLLAAWGAAGPVERLARLLTRWQGGRALARLWLWETEALELVETLRGAGQGAGAATGAGVGTAGAPVGGSEFPVGRDRELWPLWLLARFAPQPGRPALEEALQHPSARVRLTAHQGLARQGRATPPTVRGLPASPPWAEPGDPAWRDPFSGAWDRRFLRKHWQGSHIEAPPLDADERQGPPVLAASHLWVLLVDVDRLGRINDGNGVATGDRVLLAVNDVLVQHAGDRVARWGGDEFMIHWEGDDGPALGEALRQSVAALELDGLERPVRPTVTVGVTRSGPFAEAYQRVDQALYLPRNEGLRDVVRVLV